MSVYCIELPTYAASGITLAYAHAHGVTTIKEIALGHIKYAGSLTFNKYAIIAVLLYLFSPVNSTLLGLV